MTYIVSGGTLNLAQSNPIPTVSSSVTKPGWRTRLLGWERESTERRLERRRLASTGRVTTTLSQFWSIHTCQVPPAVLFTRERAARRGEARWVLNTCAPRRRDNAMSSTVCTTGAVIVEQRTCLSCPPHAHANDTTHQTQISASQCLVLHSCSQRIKRILSLKIDWLD